VNGIRARTYTSTCKPVGIACRDNIGSLAKGNHIHAFSAEVDGRDGTLHLIVDKFTVAKKTLVENGWEAAEEKVLVLTLVDKPGSLAFIASKLAEMGINIRHAYAGAADAGAADKGKIKMYLGVSDLTQARKALR